MSTNNVLQLFVNVPIYCKFKILSHISHRPELLEILCNISPEVTDPQYNGFWIELYKNTFKCFPGGIFSSTVSIYSAYITEVMMKYTQHTRRSELSNALSKVGLYIRADSTLCTSYINNMLLPSDANYLLKDVVRTCIEMRWLFDYCHMKKELRKYMRNTNKSYSSELFSHVKETILNKHPVPKELPWISQFSKKTNIHAPLYYDYDNDSNGDDDDYFY